MHPPDQLPATWRERADQLRRYGAEEQALTLVECANDLEDAWRIWRTEPLTLSEAAEVSGYSADHLGRLVREGTIPNRGRPGAPRVTREDLPTKPVKKSPVAKCQPSSDRNPRQIVQSIIQGDR